MHVPRRDDVQHGSRFLVAGAPECGWVPVSAFHLHARLVEGSLGAFSRDETRASTTDSWSAARIEAEELRDAGFTVWI